MAEDFHGFALSYCWWFRNPANQLRLVVYLPLFTRFYNYIPGGCLEFLPSTVLHPCTKELYISPYFGLLSQAGDINKKCEEDFSIEAGQDETPTDLTGWSFSHTKISEKKRCEHWYWFFAQRSLRCTWPFIGFFKVDAKMYGRSWVISPWKESCIVWVGVM